MMTAAWRPMGPADLPDVQRIGEIVHPRYPEREAVPAERLRLFPAGCLIAAKGPATVGYAIAHPGLIGRPPALDTLLGKLPHEADCLHIHDVALLPEARGSRLGAAAVALLMDVARTHGYRAMALVAVNDSAGFWSQHGFSAAVEASRLSSYGDDAAFMRRAI